MSKDRAAESAQPSGQEAAWRSVLDSMAQGLVLFDASGRVSYVNQRAAAFFNCHPDSLTGATADEAYQAIRAQVHDPDLVWRRWLQAAARPADLPVFDIQIVGDTPVELRLQVFPVRGSPRVSLGLHLQEIGQVKQQARAEERSRIAMDLHDGPVQALYGAGLALAAEERVAGYTERTTGVLRRTRSQINAIIRELREYTVELQPRPPGWGLRQGLKELQRELTLAGGLRAEVRFDAADEVLDPRTARELLYIAQEAGSNILRHAEATAVEITVTGDGGVLTLTVADNGRGFNMARRRLAGGLLNMSIRARSLGGSVVISSRPGTGTQVCVQVPLAGLPPAPAA